MPILLAGIAPGQDAQAGTLSPRRLLEVSDLGNPAISPDGRQVAFRMEQASIERNTYDTFWYVQALDGRSPPRRVADGGEPLREHATGVVLPSPAIWSPDGRWIYYRARLDGRVSVWRAAADGSEARAVTSDDADVREFALDAGGRMLRYSVGATRDEVVAAELSEYDQGVRIDGSVMLAGSLFRSSRVEGRAATQRFLGDWFSAGPLLAEVPDRWKAVDLTTLAARELLAAEIPPPSPVPVGPSGKLPEPTRIVPHPDDGRIALLLPGGDVQPGMLQPLDSELAVLPDRRSSRPVRCMDALCRHRTISDIRWRPGSDEVLFTTTDYDRGRAQSIYRWNVATGAVHPVVVSDGLVSGSQRHWDIPCALSADTLVCVAAEAAHPPRLEAIDIESGQRRTLFAPNKGLEADITAIAPAKLLRWTDEQGRAFTGQLFEAVGAGEGDPPPLFVTFYTCQGFLRGGLGDEWALASLVEQGISALCINALPGFRLDFVERHDQGRSAVESVVALLSAQGRIDRSRVGMGGLSFGSEVTLWTLAHSDVVAAASVSSISTTPSYYLFNSLREAFRTNLARMWQLGAPEETPERWKEISPVFRLDRIRAPILFQLPEQEFRMLLDYAVPLLRRYQGDLYVFPEEAHIKFQPRHKLAVYERNTDWFRFWLQDYEDPSLDKAGQYRVWRNMKSQRVKAQTGATIGD
ncbi:Atxe2 family lasso peptide isopeptidase [[Pseudomonas] boreopolis]|uniref:Atxe2 family lasso peptide isopeptidase n=1 Tax=Xanthomonas boreopolis TaxID=86183 RepID=UPI003DA0F853